MIAFKIKPGRTIHYFGLPVEVIKLTPGGVLVQAEDSTVEEIYRREAAAPPLETPAPEPMPTPAAATGTGSV